MGTYPELRWYCQSRGTQTSPAASVTRSRAFLFAGESVLDYVILSASVNSGNCEVKIPMADWKKAGETGELNDRGLTPDQDTLISRLAAEQLKPQLQETLQGLLGEIDAKGSLGVTYHLYAPCTCRHTCKTCSHESSHQLTGWKLSRENNYDEDDDEVPAKGASFTMGTGYRSYADRVR